MAVTALQQDSGTDEVFERLLARVAEYRPDADLALLRAAYTYACERHTGQLRMSGEPFVCHPAAVAEILASLEMDVPILAASLLHDVVEDTGCAVEELAERFGSEIAALVDGVTKLKLMHVDTSIAAAAADEEVADATEEARAKRRQETFKTAQNLRKVFLAMAKDLRVMIIKLADRLHNMRTLGALPPEKQRRIARETMDIFAPLAHRLGVWQIKWELEDLAFMYLEPERYEELRSKVAGTREQQQTEVDEAIGILRDRLIADGIRDPHITGRPKHIYSIYQKLQNQELDFSQLYDLIALRVIVHTRQDCYQALGVVSALWTPIAGMYADYVARSKTNMYQSLHIKVVGPQGRPLEVQIRTWEMHRTAEFGIAAHWAYKEKGEGGKVADQYERKLSWLRQQLFDWQTDSRDSGDFLRSVTEDLFADQVFVFTPMGDVLDLPAGATPIDFAFRIHSDVGMRAFGAKVNAKMVPLSYQFKNGDVVEIITRSSSTPSRDWLGLAKTSHARAKIRAYFKRLAQGESSERGREMLEREAERLGLDARALLKDDALRAVASSFSVPNETDLLAAVGYGTVGALAVINKLRPEMPPTRGIVVGRGRADDTALKVTAGAIDNVMFRRSRCCLPIPGDEIVGYVSRGRGIALHRRECPNVTHYETAEPERLTAVDYTGGGQVFSVSIAIDAMDRTGLLADVGSIFGELKTNITAVRTQSHRDRTATLAITAEVHDVEHLARVFQTLRRLSDVLEVTRVMAGKER
jgi:GTP diphosphokinase / guanosine-3',5'-bis(diphosphate) 3'-diphosphatase